MLDDLEDAIISLILCDYQWRLTSRCSLESDIGDVLACCKQWSHWQQELEMFILLERKHIFQTSTFGGTRPSFSGVYVYYMYKYYCWAIIRSGIITLQTPQTRSFWVWNSPLKQHFWGKTRHKDLSSFSHTILDILDFFLVACCYKCVHRQTVDLALLA